MALLKARIAGEWVEVGVGPSDPLRYPIPRPPTPADIRAGDVVEYYWAYWLWENKTRPPAAWPLSAETEWHQISGPPSLAESQLAAWTGVQRGNTTWVSPTGGTQPASVGRRLLIRGTSEWSYADRTEFIETPINANASIPTAYAVASNTAFHLLCPTMVTLQCAVHLTTVSGGGQWELSFESGAGVPVQYVARQHCDMTTALDAMLQGIKYLTFPAGANNTQAVVRKVTGTVTVSTASARYFMTVSW